MANNFMCEEIVAVSCESGMSLTGTYLKKKKEVCTYLLLLYKGLSFLGFLS